MTARRNTAPQQRARIGADHARVWVRQINLRNPYAKSILMAVANYMNEDGAAWPGLSTLAQDTDISEDTIASRLRWCEHIGAIVVLKCWVDENGRRNYEKRGRPTSSEIRFLFEADLDAIEAAARDAKGEQALRGAAARAHAARADDADADADADASDVTDSDDSEFCPRRGRGPAAPDQHPVSPQVAPDQPPPTAGRSRNLEQEDSPPNPPPGGVGPAPDGWKEFEEAYPGPILRQSYARNAFAGLNAVERELATKAARGYGLWIKSRPRPPNVLGAHLFLKERDAWGQYVGQSDIVSQRRSVPADSEEARAYAGLRKVYLAAPARVASDGTVSLPRPLTPAEMAFADLPPPSQWVFISQRNQQGSWAGFLADALPGIARRPLVDHHDGHADVGFFAPWPWPPLKDGSLCTTGPPASAA